jgi:hypothetical protein
MHVLHLHGLDVSCFFKRFFHSLIALRAAACYLLSRSSRRVIKAAACLPPQPIMKEKGKSVKHVQIISSLLPLMHARTHRVARLVPDF